MQRVQLVLPEKFMFSTEITIQIGDINYGQHLSNDALLRLAHEARIRFLASMGYSELDIVGVSLIMTDAQIQYINQAFHSDSLRINLSVTNYSRTGFSLFYQVFNLSTDQEVARLGTNLAFFDYQKQKIARTPQAFIEKIDYLLMEPVVRCASLVDRRGQSLLLVRTEKGPLWYLPGGKIEAGETPKEALKREISEELGVALKDKSIEYLYTVYAPAYNEKARLELICFQAEWMGDVRAQAEIEECAWLDITQTHLFAPAIRQMVSSWLEVQNVV